MAQLPPDGTWLMQQMDGLVHVFNRDTEEQLVEFDPGDPSSFGPALQRMWETDVFNGEQKSFAAFWTGYYFAHAGMEEQ